MFFNKFSPTIEAPTIKSCDYGKEKEKAYCDRIMAFTSGRAYYKTARVGSIPAYFCREAVIRLGLKAGRAVIESRLRPHVPS